MRTMMQCTMQTERSERTRRTRWTRSEWRRGLAPLAALIATTSLAATRADAVECSGVETLPWINEVDYDDYTGFPNNDRQEFIEIAGPAGTDISGWRILAVEGNSSFFICGSGIGGSNGNAYFDSALPAGSVIPDDGNGIGYFVVCLQNTSTTRVSQGVCDAVVPGVAGDSNLKNGKLLGTTNECPDGVLLLQPGGSFVDAVAWEGLMPNSGSYGPMFQNPRYNAGRDAGFDNFESLTKTSSTLTRATASSEWVETNDSAGAQNPGQSLSCDQVQDADGDGVENDVDNCPSTPNPGQTDTDGDGVGDACNDASDTDGDEWADALDNCPSVANAGQTDTDGDGVGNACNDAQDADGDEWADGLDNCPGVANPNQQDTDGDGVGNACNDAQDADGDEWADGLDNCPAIANASQLDTDADGVGDACDNCVAVANPGQEDGDNDGQGDACETVTDSDGDGVADALDNCPLVANADQLDTDGDGAGDACNDASDTDGDEWADTLDNCPADANPLQEDSDNDGIGDACDTAAAVPGLAPLAATLLGLLLAGAGFLRMRRSTRR